MGRYTARDYATGLAHGARLLLKHRGDLTAVQADLDADKEWARFCARHGLPRNTERPPQGREA